MFTGVITAIVTPFRGDAVDEEALRKLCDEQIAAGLDGRVPVGTTGEPPTLTCDEHIRVIKVVVDAVKKRVPVIAGTGSNSTREAIELSQAAQKVGADGLLLVTPYYNKPGQDHLYRHLDRKSTRLNSSHQIISYAVFCLKKKKNTKNSLK